MSKVNALYHIVFCTKNRQMTISNTSRRELYRFIWSIIQKKNCYLYRISGTPNHIHILLNLHPRVALADIVRDIKSNSSGWLKWNPLFPDFNGWAKEYFAATISYRERDRVIDYIKDQQAHHGIQDLGAELQLLCSEEGFEIHEEDLI